jgi:alpha-galactosidase
VNRDLYIRVAVLGSWFAAACDATTPGGTNPPFTPPGHDATTDGGSPPSADGARIDAVSTDVAMIDASLGDSTSSSDAAPADTLREPDVSRATDGGATTDTVTDTGPGAAMDASLDRGPDAHNDAGLDASSDAVTGDGSIDPGKPVPCGEIGWIAEPTGMRFAATCDGTSLQLLPIVKIKNVWYGGGKNGACLVEGTQVMCPAAEFGRVGVEQSAGNLRAFWEAGTATDAQALGLDGSMKLAGATGVLSNGFQSWSQSGVLALAAAPADTALNTALAATGEDEVYRKGKENSWWYTFAGGGAMSFSAGAIAADTLRSWTQVYKEGTDFHVRLVNGAGETITAAKDDRKPGEWFHVEIGPNLETSLARYGHSLATRRTAHPGPTPTGWNSWYDLWDDVRADQIAKDGVALNADIAKTILEAAIPQRAEPLWIVVDDGWQKAWGTWEANDKFPGGVSALATLIQARGMRLGIWMAPLLVEPTSPVATDHPDWLVTGATYNHPSHGMLRVLDVTHPDAAEHLRSVVKSLTAAGASLLKIDFLFAGALEGGRHEPATGMQAYRRALAVIREAAGDDVRLVAVGAPPIGTFDVVDAWRLGNDIAFKPVPVINFPLPTWSFIANQARQFTARWPYCLATLCDADPFLLRQLTQEEVTAGSWVALSTGGALFLSDDLTKLATTRRTWGLDAERVALGLGGVPATPVRFFTDKLPTELVSMKDPNNGFSAEHDIPSIWRLPGGSRIAFNFKGAAVTVEGTSVPAHAVRKLP